MNQPYSRISENLLFATLLAAAIGWTALSAVSGLPAAAASATTVAGSAVSSAS